MTRAGVLVDRIVGLILIFSESTMDLSDNRERPSLQLHSSQRHNISQKETYEIVPDEASDTPCGESH
jgi:hypothetical protein